MSATALAFAVRAAGASQIALGFGHAALWRCLGWSDEIRRTSPLTARVFAVHTFFVAFVLVALGALGLGYAELLVEPSTLGRLVLGAVALFWTLRLVAQPLVFDPVMLRGSPYRTVVRASATLLFASYVLVYAWALARQL